MLKRSKDAHSSLNRQKEPLSWLIPPRLSLEVLRKRDIG
jgi:hypothetical protein